MKREHEHEYVLVSGGPLYVVSPALELTVILRGWLFRFRISLLVVPMRLKM